jgi:hypothetical protein
MTDYSLGVAAAVAQLEDHIATIEAETEKSSAKAKTA